MQPRADADRARLPRPPDGNARARRRQRLRHPAAPPRRSRGPARTAGCTYSTCTPSAMSIPTLQGLQTALSGLLAEQQALDIDRQQHRQREHRRLLARDGRAGDRTRRSRSRRSRLVTGQGAQLGTGVTVANITRIRNVYLDAQYRTQNSALSGASTQSEELAAGTERVQRTVELGDRQPAVGLLERVEQPRQLADQRSGQGGRGGGRPTAGHHAQRAQRAAARRSPPRPANSTNALTGAGGRSRKTTPTRSPSSTARSSSPKKRASSPTTCSTAATCCSTSSPALAQVTVTEQPDHTDTVSFGDAAKPLVEGTTVNWPQALTEAAGGSSARCSA